MIDQLSIDLSEYRIKKANDLLIQATILHNNGKYDGSVNRSYYAVFNSIRSILALLKSDSPKHSGVLSLFDKAFVKTKIFDKRFSIIAHSAFENRQENDYEDFYIPTLEDSEIQLKNCEEFIREVERMRENLINGKIKLPELDG
ncbi:MAG: HEPN domain-containing protein [Ignavibacteriaceae bacterium]|nr:HEPN domain-containing protein [Ignavibacteriaceae bacterium]